MAFTITVWQGNKPAKNTRVGISFSGWSRGHTESKTDNEGRAFFQSDTGNGTVFVDGKAQYTGMLSGDVKITLGLLSAILTRITAGLFFLLEKIKISMQL